MRTRHLSGSGYTRAKARTLVSALAIGSMAALWLAPISGCGSSDRAAKHLRFTRVPVAGIVYADTTAEFPHLLYADGSLSLNDRCPVRRSRLNRRLPPIYVNHRPIGFC